MAATWRSGSGGAFHLDDERMALIFRSRLTPRLADLLEIAMECYAMDRLAKRSLRDALGRGWCRSLPVTLPVRDREFWTDPEVAAALQGLLDWLTGDEWLPTFVAHHGDPRFTEMQQTLFSLPPDGPAAVACFSGGLDSFAGVAIDLAGRPNEHLVLVGAYGASRAGSLQRWLADELARRSGRVIPVIVRAHLVGAKHKPQDARHRTRGLVFLSLAAGCALLAGLQEVRVYENGLGAINLPYGRAQVGAHMARSAHPRTLLAMGRLIELMGDEAVRFTLPHLYETKAQVVERIPAAFCELAARTYSCDGWASVRRPREEERSLRCGHCSSCLLRRQALHAADWRDVDAREDVHVDAFSATHDEDTFELRLMLAQVADLAAAVGEADPWEALVRSYPELVVARDALVDLGEPDGIEDRLVALYRRYVDEWRYVPSLLVDRFPGKDLAA